jgi:exodeoxyribonuclease-3
LLGQGWTDAIKATHPDAPVYTFWDYLRQAWGRNAGMRLDHILLSASLASGLRETGVDTWVRGLPGASDHAPAWANIDTPRALTLAPDESSPSRDR